MASILIVDDDDAIRRALHKTLERSGHTVVEAGSAAEALSIIGGKTRVDAVISDVMMPVMNGLVFYRRLIDRAPRLQNRVIFLTGANRDPEVHLPIEQFGVPLLGKLDDMQLVMDALRLLLMRPEMT